MLAQQRLRLNDGDCLQDRREPAIKQNEEQPVAIVSRMRPRTLRCRTATCRLSAAFSASSRGSGSDGSTSSLRKKMNNAIIVASRYAIPSLDQSGQASRYTQVSRLLK